MKITLLQTDIAWLDVAENARRLGVLLDRNPGADLYILPEMWATGFDVRPTADTLRAGAEGLRAMQRLAAERHCALAGTLPVDADGPVNRFFLVAPDGSAEHYDKHHLFTYGGEDRTYRAGKSRKVVTLGGVRILLQVCYDLRFPVFSRNHGDYDLVLYVANWPASRREAWDILLRARAIENQCYVCGVNRVGTDPACRYSGGTTVVDPRGRILGAVPDDVEGAVTFLPDMEALAAFREKFPVLRDAD